MARQRKLDAEHGLDGRGLALWRKVVADYELEPAELVVLGQACRLLTVVDQLDAAVDRAGPVSVEGRPHPALVEARQARLALGRLLAQLDLDDDTAELVSPTTARARKAAAARWGHRDDLEARRRGSRGA